MSSVRNAGGRSQDNSVITKRRSAILFSALMLLSSYSALEFSAWEALASSDQDGDGLSYGLEFYINTQPQDWDSDNDGLPDGWEWQYGLNPLSPNGDNGSTGDPDGDAFSNLNEYQYSIPTGWDLSSTPNVLDNGVWWNGTVPVRDWDEESAMQLIQGLNSDGADEDPRGNVCFNTFDDDKDGMVDNFDGDGDGDSDCSSDDDDGDGLIDEDPDGWDTDGDGMPDGWEAANGLDPTSNSNQDGTFGDPDGDGLINIKEYVNPAWGTRNGTTTPPTQYFRPGPLAMTATETPCNPVLSLGPGGCEFLTAEVDGITSTDPQSNDTDGDGLNDSYEALILLTDPTSVDTDSDGIEDGIEVLGQYGDPPQASDPRNNNTDGDQFDDGEEDLNGNGIVDMNETDPTRIEDSGDFDGDGIQNWEENMTCTLWNVFDTDGGGVSDGDELLPFHNSDPCLSEQTLTLQILAWDAVTSSLTLNSTADLDQSPIDWRQNDAPMAYYVQSNGTLVDFRYESVDIGVLRNVDTDLPANTSTVLFTNFSWCWDGSVGAVNDPICDDDYSDSDGDGLADWEEYLATWGFPTNPNLVDTDSDGVDDLDEILNGTDPLEPCENLLDTDGDGLNNYFENTTGCVVIFPGMGGNFTNDTYFTLWNESDTDNGGVTDFQEYLDGTNPQDNPNDDRNPVDTDGDGIPDTIENSTGTDWRDPDTDGGGIPDGQECTSEFWDGQCEGSTGDPWDPSDDISQNSMYLLATTQSSILDPANKIYWRWHTYDHYTRISWGVNTTLVGNTQMSTDFSTTQGVADQQFWDNSTLMGWEIQYEGPGVADTGEELILPHNTVNFTGWIDPTAGLNFSNFTRDVLVDGSSVDTVFITTPQVTITQAIRENTTAFTGTDYATDLPREFTDRGGAQELVTGITQSVINDSGALSAWDKVSAIANFLTNGNDTFTFLRNNNGTEVPDMVEDEGDLAYWMLNNSFEGSCDQYSSLFAVMLRTVDIPSRKVTGFSGGYWNGEAFEVYGKDFTSWVEVHLQTNQNLGDADLGWIPFEACPPMSIVEVSDETWGPLTVDRDLAGDSIWMNGTLRFSDNQTAVDGVTVEMYLVKSNMTSLIPGIAASSEHFIGSTVTDANGSFNITGLPSEAVDPGNASLVILTKALGYVGFQGIYSNWDLNISDDISINITEPQPIVEPKLGIGVNTTISGLMTLENAPYNDVSLIDSMQVIMNYTTVQDGPVSLISSVGPGGYFEFSVSINESEQEGLVAATIDYAGWHQYDLNNATSPIYHIRPTSKSFNLNLTQAPNLTITLEGEGLNNTILEINRPIYLNGTALSKSETPEALNGTLEFQMRRSGTNAPFITLASWYLNDSDWLSSPGQFSLNWSFLDSDVPIPAGLVEVRYQYLADQLFARDESTVVDEHGIKSYIQFNYTMSPSPKGSVSEVLVRLSDHTGSEITSYPGAFSLLVDGTEVWNESAPDVPKVMTSWTPSLLVDAGDYPWVLSYNGSTWVGPNSTSDTVRIQGRASPSYSLGTEWVPMGNTTWVTGTIVDFDLNTTVTGNNTSVSLFLDVPSSLPAGPDGNPLPPDRYPLGSDWLNLNNGEFNITFSMPGGIGSGVYDAVIILDFEKNSPDGVPYYFDPSPENKFDIGIQTMFDVESNVTSAVVVAGENLTVSATVVDIENNERLNNATVEIYFDWGGPLQQLLNTSITGTDGVVEFQTLVPSDSPPGYYDVLVLAPDDLTDSLDTPNAGRWLSGETLLNLTVQVQSNVRIDNAPLPEVTAGQSFLIDGQVLDSFDQNRSVDGPVSLEVFFLNDPSEKLITGFATTSNGSFSLTVPTDPFGDGVTSGLKTLVISVENGSSPFYLTGSGSESILVRGVVQFNDRVPLINTIVDRGSSISFGAKIVESSDNDRELQGMNVSARFHDTWISTEATSDSGGIVNFSFDVPHSHPLGTISVMLMFNGSNGTETLHSSFTFINTIIIRSPTSITFSPITSNPSAGDFLDLSGNLTSSNGSGIVDRSGNPLSPSLTFLIDGSSNGFSVTGGSVSPNGSWNARIFLDMSFPRGTHNITATYTPTVNYYSSSSGDTTFDSRGFSMVSIIYPTDLDPDARTIRGDSFDLNISVIDNSGANVNDVEVKVLIDGLEHSTGLTDSQGLVNTSISTDSNRDPGPMTVTVVFEGINGTTGLLGDQTWTRVVILAPTVIDVTAISGTSVAGEQVIFSGTLLDEHGMPLIEDGAPKGGVLHLSVDGIDVGPIYIDVSNSTTGTWQITYDIPLDTDYGQHTFTIEFLGGFTWVDPMGQGDSLNPEYYLASEITLPFNVTQTSQVVLTTPQGEIDRNELLLIEGILTDGAGRPLDNRTLEAYMNGQLLTSLNVDSNGSFSLFFPVPSNMPLGPREVTLEFQGEEFIIGSNSTTIFTVFSPTTLSLTSPEPLAVGDVLNLRGDIRDNLPDGWLANHSLQIFIDGILIGTTISEEDGSWHLSWIVSEFLDVGVHEITVISPDQGYYRQSTAEANLSIAYHTTINLNVENSVATRGGKWDFSGRLYDSDSDGTPGLEGRNITFFLDGDEITTISTGTDGTFSLTYDLGYSISRGGHEIKVVYSGEELYLSSTISTTVFSKADIEIELLTISDEVVRGDETRPIKIRGRILEIGGDANTMEEMELSLSWEGSLEPNAVISWDPATGQFLITSNAKTYMPPGPSNFTIDVSPDAERFLNGASIDLDIQILVSVNFEFIPDSLFIKRDQNKISGKINVTASDDNRRPPIEGVSITARLVNETATHFTVVGMTDENGIFDYQFESFHEDHPFWDRSFWGVLSIEFSSDSEIIDPVNSTQLSLFSEVSISYQAEESESLLQPAILSIILAIVIGVVSMLVVSLRRKRQAAIDELAGVFSYTAELLAAGDEVREAIFNCYEGLCSILMGRGFLRRDFETVREFEMAIRSALPISEQSLLSLDRIFEEARYSSHILGEPHRESAQLALNSVLQEIDQLEDVPARPQGKLIED